MELSSFEYLSQRMTVVSHLDHENASKYIFGRLIEPVHISRESSAGMCRVVETSHTNGAALHKFGMMSSSFLPRMIYSSASYQIYFSFAKHSLHLLSLYSPLRDMPLAEAMPLTKSIFALVSSQRTL